MVRRLCGVVVAATLVAGCSATTTPAERWVEAMRATLAALPEPPAAPGMTLVTDDHTVVYGPTTRPIHP